MKTRVTSENGLLSLARELDPQALSQIYDQYSPAIYRYAMRLMGNITLAEECVAETFSRLLQMLHAGKGPREHLQAYLYRVAHNWITDQYRREPLMDELAETLAGESDSPEEVVSQRIHQQRLQDAIRQLTPDQQQVIALKYLEDCENEEIALVLGKPVGAVKSLQHRALASLQRFLLEKEPI
jgi:RNA polymerase sigma-70 factor (ECF subfamily)